MRQREIGFVDVPIYRSAAAAPVSGVAARAAAALPAAAVATRRGAQKNPSNGFGGEKMRFTFGVDLTRAMLLQY